MASKEGSLAAGDERVRDVLTQLREEAVCKPELQVAGFSFIRLGNVFPTYFDDSVNVDVMTGSIDRLPLPKATDNRVLEIGSGNGCLGASLYLKNKARISRLLAADINPDAVENTKLNFAKYSIPGEARLSDVYNNLEPGEKFDLIFWAMPFCSASPPPDVEITMLDLSCLDVGHKAFGRFIGESPQHLSPNGKVLFYFSPSMPSLESVKKIAAAHNRKLELIWEEQASGGWDVPYVMGLYEAVAIP